MTWNALDAATANPDPTELAEAGIPFIARYVGTAYQRYGVSRDYIDWCLASGVGFLPIFEEWGSQFLTGYQGALDACGRMMESWDYLGLPRDGSCTPAVALLDPSPAALYGNESVFADWCRGWNDALPFDRWMGYGSKAALDIASEVAGRMVWRWGVGTWGFGERADGSLPDDVPADMIQHGNAGSPWDRTDWNTLFTPYVGQWGGPFAPAGGRMTTGQDLVNEAAKFVGQRYSTAAGRDDPNSVHKDCSGLIAAAYKVATGNDLGANVSVTIYDLAVRNDLWIPFERAAGIAGACLLIPDDPYLGWGSQGHIGFSDGAGGTVEATPPRVQRLTIGYQPWGPNACLLPGIDYSNNGHGGGQPVQKEDDALMWCAVVVMLDGVHAYACAGSTILFEFGGAPGAYGIPQEALDSGLKVVRVDRGTAGDTGWDRLVKASEFSLTDPRNAVIVEGGVTAGQKAAVDAAVAAADVLDAAFTG